MYRKIHILLLPLLAFLLFAGSPGAGSVPNAAQADWKTAVHKHFEINRAPASVEQDGQSKQVSRFAMRAKGQHVVSAPALTGFAYIKLSTPWYFTRPVYYDHSNPVFHKYFSSSSLRGPPAVC